MLIGSVAIGILTGLISAVCAVVTGFGFLAILSAYSIGGLIGTLIAVFWSLAPIDGAHIAASQKQRSSNVRVAGQNVPTPDWPACNKKGAAKPPLFQFFRSSAELGLCTTMCKPEGTKRAEHQQNTSRQWNCCE